MQGALADSWLGLPEPLRARLALASTGWRRLADCGALCLGLARAAKAAERARLLALAAEIFLWAFGENPLHGPLAAEILAHADLPLPEASRAALAAVAARWRAPGEKEGGPAYFERLRDRGEPHRLAEFLAGQVAKDPGALFWRDTALALACAGGAATRELERAALGGLDSLPGLEPVARGLAAQAAFLRGDVEPCLRELSGQPELFSPALAPARAGLTLLRAGETAQALPRLRAALALAPWQASLALVAADAATGLREALAPPPGPVLVLLHTRNTAARLEATLAGLFASDLSTAGGGGARVAVLDRGSCDETGQVLDAWRQRAGEALLRVALPVDIGAPAAWNWLCALPEARQAETLAFVDEDVALPPDWLPRLGAGLGAYPQAGAVGCCVARRESPWLLHAAAGRLLVPHAPTDMDFQSLTPNPFGLCDAFAQGPDWGLAAFAGPCATAPGGCRLISRAAYDLAGGYALALGPGGADGLENFDLDLRLHKTGRHAVHQGHLRVLRGGAPRLAGAASNRLGDRYKLQTLHPREDLADLLSAQALRLGEAAAGAFAALDATGARP